MRIAVYAFDDITMFHLSVPQMVFDEVARQGLADWSTVLFSESAHRIRTAEGYTITGIGGVQAARSADVIVVPSWTSDGREPSRALRRLLSQAHGRGATIVGLCLGALVVADAGLLEGRRAVTHWHAVDDLAARHPGIRVETSALYLDHGDVLTSAGTASGLDACLHLVRTRLGAEAANTVARSLVVAPHREGGQSQYIDRPIASHATADPIAATCQWALERLDEDLSIERLADVSHMSRRSFVRSFRASTGSAPAAWVRSQRLDEARRLLETTELSVDQVAAACGFGSAVTLRQNFATSFGSTPTSYRRRFSTRTNVPTPPRHRG